MNSKLKIRMLDFLQFVFLRDHGNPYRRLNYESYIDDNKINVLKPRRGRKQIVALLDNSVVCASLGKNPYQFTLYPDIRYPVINYKLTLEDKTFPGLLPDSKIINIVLLRYMRSINTHTRIKAWRCVVFTDKCQIFHNFPGNEKTSPEDINRFEESVVWDISGRKYPSKSVEHQSHEFYYPGLPDECYQHHPAVETGKFDDHFVIRSNSKEDILSRFYFHKRCIESNPFVYMGGFINDYQMTTIGTYRSNIETGSRICVFFSSDGGRQWFNRYEFGDYGDYQYVNKERGYDISNWGNEIKYDCNITNKDAEVTVLKRTISLNEANADNHFKYEAVSKVKAIYLKNTLVVETEGKHGLEDGNIITLCGSEKCKEKEWFIKKDSSTDKVLFKVKALDEYTFLLYEFIGNSDNHICCRHIHHINRQKDGWIIGTGEIYPNGWLLYIQQKECDYFNINACNALAPFHIHILTSNESSVQRTIGCEMIDEKRIVFASDHPTLSRPLINIRNTSFSHSSTGIFVGDLCDIDCFEKFKCIYNSTEVSYFFRKIDSVYVFSGQLGEVAISIDDLHSWLIYHFPKTLRCFMGCNNNAFVIDGYVFIKR